VARGIKLLVFAVQLHCFKWLALSKPVPSHHLLSAYIQFSNIPLITRNWLNKNFNVLKRFPDADNVIFLLNGFTGHTFIYGCGNRCLSWPVTVRYFCIWHAQSPGSE